MATGARTGGRVREQGFRREVRFEVPTTGDEPGGEMTEAPWGPHP